MLSFLLNYHLKAAARYFQHKKAAKLITSFLFLLLLGSLSVGLFYFFRGGFRFIAYDQFLADAFLLFIFELFLLFITLLVFFSSIISSLIQLYRKPQYVTLMQSPNFNNVPGYVLFKTLGGVIWPVLFIALPAIVALWSVFSVNFFGLCIALLAILVLTAVAAVSGLVLVQLVSGVMQILSKALKTHTLKFLSVGLIVCVAFISFYAWQQAVAVRDFEALFQVRDLSLTKAYTQQIYENFQFLPSHYAAAVFSSVQQHQTNMAWIYLAELTGILVILLVAMKLLSRHYLPVWQGMQEGRVHAESGSETTVYKSTVFPRFLKTPLGAVFEKEGLISMRSLRSVMWLVFLLLIWLMQTGLNTILGENIATQIQEGVFSLELIQIFQYVTTVFFMSAFVLRFGFPSFSTELKSAWILGTAPVAGQNIFWAKFFFYSVVFTAIGLAVVWANLALIHLTGILSFGLFLYFLLAITVIVALGLSLGALFPNFETDDPQLLSTSMPGLLFMLGSLLYGVLGAGVLYFAFLHETIIGVVVFVLISILAIAALLLKAAKSIDRLEYTKEF